MMGLSAPPRESVVYEDKKLYVCLASYPITRGHTVVVWKGDSEDINALSCEEYDYIMNIVDVTRDALLKTLGVEKVYLLYMDEIKKVHWHLVPRYEEKGFNIFLHEPKENKDFSLAGVLKDVFHDVIKKHREFGR